jgi:2,5-dihydroxypyridine 5,6-dioxygenase
LRDNSAEAVELFRRELLLCGLDASENVAIVASQGKLVARADAFLTAASLVGASAYVLTIPPVEGVRGTIGVGQTSLSGQRDLVELLKRADLVVDLAFLHFSPEQTEILEAGVRVLACVEPLPVLGRLFPTVELRRRVEGAAERLAAATELRVTSAAGTDVTYSLTGGLRVLDEYGFTDSAGRWDHWPSGFVATHAAEDGVEGRVVLKANDVLLLPVPHVVREPVTLEIRGGYIVDIAGDNLDSVVLRDFFAAAEDDPEALAVSHIGWGLNRDARWEVYPHQDALQMDFRAYSGNVLFSTGPNTDMGGTRETPWHLDIPMRDCSLYLDGEPVVEKGQLMTAARV